MRLSVLRPSLFTARPWPAALCAWLLVGCGSDGGEASGQGGSAAGPVAGKAGASSAGKGGGGHGGGPAAGKGGGGSGGTPAAGQGGGGSSGAAAAGQGGASAAGGASSAGQGGSAAGAGGASAGSGPAAGQGGSAGQGAGGSAPPPCPCLLDGINNFCQYPPSAQTAGCAMLAPGGYCNPDGDGDASTGATNWEKGFYDFLQVCKPACGDAHCSYGECATCPGDCTGCAPPEAQCGDGKCEGDKGEGCGNCAQDCGACPTCGDSVCNGGESKCSCPADCGAPGCGECGIGANDGQCNCGESKCTAPNDCGAPGCGECGNPACGPTCGDGTCDSGETCGTCAGDCGACPVELGDPFFALSPDQGSFLDGQAKVLRGLGAGMVRFQFGDWGNPVNRAYLDQLVDAARAAGLHVYAELNYATLGGDVVSWHQGYTDSCNSFCGQFAQAAGEIAEHFQGRVFAYEIWNEPDGAPRPFGYDGSVNPDGSPKQWPSPATADWDGACGAYAYGTPYVSVAQSWALCPKQLGAITTNAYMAIKAKDPAAKVVAGNVLFHGGDAWVAKEYWKKVEESGAVGWFKANQGGGKPPWDHVGVHPYAYRSSDGKLGAQLGAFKAVMAAYGDGASLAITEYGWDTVPGGDANVYATEDDQASLLLGAFDVAKQQGVAFFVWFNYLDAPSALHMGLRRYQGGPAGWKPSAKAFCQAAGAPSCPAP